MPGTDTLLPPAVQWAQRKNLVYVSICLEDCKNPTIKLENDKLFFKSTGGADKKEYEVTINFFQEVNAEESKYVVRDRIVEIILKKKEDGPYWKRLVKENTKLHWLKVDFGKWRDEDDSDQEETSEQNPGDLEDMFKQMGGLGNPGMGPGKDLGDLDAGGDEDSDDEALPDLE